MSNLQFYFFELKWRLFYFLFSVILTFIISYNFQLEILYILGKPFLEFQQTFVFLELTEAFYTLLKISTIFTIITNSPFFAYHIWSFFVPSFYKIERKKTNVICGVIFGLILSEFWISFFILLPQICHFLLSYEITVGMNHSELELPPLFSLEFNARIQSYVEILVKILCSIFLLFQFPLLVYFLYSKKVLHVSNFYTNRKLLLLFSLLLAALIVPPDLISQLLVAVVFYAMFEVLIFIGLFFE